MNLFLKTIFFLIIVIGIAVYFIQNPPNLSGIFGSGPFENVIMPQSQSNQQIQTPLPQTQISQQTNQTYKISESEIPSGYTRSQISPDFRKVRIGSAYASSYSGYPSQINLYSYLNSGEKIDITGWSIVTNHGTINIPQAVNNYDFSGSYTNQDIVLSSNSNVYLYSNKSPIAINFRLNECTGYLNNNYTFNPSLPENCPSPDRSQISYLVGYCQNYIFSLAGCDVPSISVYNSFPGNDEGNACRQYLSNITPQNCYRDHRNDASFLSPNGAAEWRVWFNWSGIFNILDSSHDAVRLYDKNGLLVDQYVY